MKSRMLAVPYLVWLLIFVIVPLLFILYFAFFGGGGFTLSYFAEAITFWPEFVKSLWLALECTVICLLTAYPLAFYLSRISKRRQQNMLMIIMLPMWMNFLLRIYSLTMILETNGIINKLFGLFGLGPFHLLHTNGAVLLGMIYNFFPFMVLPLYSVMTKIDKSLIEAAQDLGSNPLNVFRKVLLPLSLPGVITGITMVFVPAASTFVISQRLGDGSMLIGDLIEMFYIGMEPSYGVGSAMSLVLMIIIIGCIGVMNLFDNDDMGDMLL